MTKHLNRKQSAADGANHSVNSVPDRITHGIYRRKIQRIENTGDADDPWVAEDFERLILWRESDPVKMDCKASGKNGQIKINACERSEAERDAQEIQAFHAKVSGDQLINVTCEVG